MVYNDIDVDDNLVCEFNSLAIQWWWLGDFTGNDSFSIIGSCDCKYSKVFKNKRYGITFVMISGGQ